jgi:hypothetical protein
VPPQLPLVLPGSPDSLAPGGVPWNPPATATAALASPVYTGTSLPRQLFYSSAQYQAAVVADLGSTLQVSAPPPLNRYPYKLLLEWGTPQQEVVIITSAPTGNGPYTFTGVLRGSDGGGPQVSHAAGAQVNHGVSAQDFYQVAPAVYNVCDTQFAGGADPTGTLDSSPAFQAAVSTCAADRGGIVQFPPGNFKLLSGITAAVATAPVYIAGAGQWATTLNYYGSGDCIRMYNPGFYYGGGIHGITIDGTNASGNSAGLHLGDMFRVEIDIGVTNFTSGTASKGVWFDNQYWWTEQLRGFIYTQNCSAHVVFDVSGTPGPAATGSFERADLRICVNAGSNLQDGVVLQNGTYIEDGPGLAIFGNPKTGTTVSANALLRITGVAPAGRPDAGAYSSISNVRLDIGAECDAISGTNGSYTIYFGSPGNAISNCYGVMDFSAAGNFMLASNAASGQFDYNGRITGDNVLVSFPQFFKTPINIISTATSSNVNIAGAGDGNQYADFLLSDNNTAHQWTFSHRQPSHNFLIYNYNGSVFTNAVTITEAGTVTLAGTLQPATGAAAVTPVQFTSGALNTTPAAGAVEYDGVSAYITNDTTSGRGQLVAEQKFRLTAAGSAITTIANYFGTTSNISLVASAEYEIEIDCWFLKTTAGTVTWTFTNSAAPASMTLDYQMSPATGIVSAPAAADLFGQQYNVTTTAPTVVSPSLTTGVNHRHKFKIRLVNGTGTSLKIQATAGAGSLTPGINSYWKARRVPLANIGTFAA